jgi:hypothetical protein
VYMGFSCAKQDGMIAARVPVYQLTDRAVG